MIKLSVSSRVLNGVAGRFNLKRWLIRLIGSLGLLVLLWRLNLNLSQITAELYRVNLGPVIVAASLILPITWLKAVRWRLILADLAIKVRFKLAWQLYGLGLSAGSLTPGQAGDAIKAWYLHDAPGYTLTNALLSVIVDRLYDLVVLMGLALVGVLWLGGDFAGQVPLLAAGAGMMSLITAGLVVPQFRARLVGPILKRLVSRKLSRAGIDNSVENLAQTRLHPASLTIALLTTLLTAGLAITRTWLLALSLGLNFGAAEVVAASSLATVASLVPVTISGIGMRDLVLVAIMARLGQSQEAAVSLSTLLLFLNLLNLGIGYSIYRLRLN